MQTRNFQTSVGWNLLLNDNRIVRRSADSIVIAGEENDGRPPFPQKADLRKTLHGISAQSFVVVLQHDPSAWRRSILPKCKAQLTLSGHTHGGQASILGCVLQNCWVRKTPDSIEKAIVHYMCLLDLAVLCHSDSIWTQK